MRGCFEPMLRTAKRYALYRRLPAQAAEDILASALERVWKKEWPVLQHEPHGRRSATVCRYMYFVAQELQRAAIRVEPVAPQDLPEPTQYDFDIADKLAAASQLSLVAAALDVLSDNERTVLELAGIAGLSNAEIALQIGKSGTHVSTLLSSARRRLRRELALSDERARQRRPRQRPSSERASQLTAVNHTQLPTQPREGQARKEGGA
ncbi:sigma-70 family RNA polymerase sigma factor [Nocardia amamiensis]|uniref:sigma-70 family RNA polymerase sigma factor n=1 Tax=Nocardia amamiensis TaxID=404578 RepID=UPI002481395C|nr:sigma-70 family RNA polymerase sigma factor [Nocardia amamiensis]